MSSHSLADDRPLPVPLVTTDTPRDYVNRAYESERLVIFRYVVSLGVDRETALDLTQETFLKLYQAVRNGEDIRTLRAWLFTAASRGAIDHHRAQGRRATLSGHDVDRWLESLPDAAESPESAALRRERLSRLMRAYQTLSAQQRACVHLRAEGLRYRDIAEVLGVSVPTVSEFMRRAIARLRSMVHA